MSSYWYLLCHLVSTSCVFLSIQSKGESERKKRNVAAMVFNLAVIESISYEPHIVQQTWKNCTSDAAQISSWRWLVTISATTEWASGKNCLTRHHALSSLKMDYRQNTASAIHLQTWLSNILWYWTIAYSTKRVVHPLLATLGFSGPCITPFFCIGCYCIVTLSLLWIPVSSSNSNTFPFTYMTPSRLCFSQTPHNVSTLSIVQIAGQSVHATVNLEWQSHQQVNLPLLALQSSATPQVGG